MHALARFDRFVLTSDDATNIRAEFQPVLLNTKLVGDELLTRTREKYRKQSGVYFWVLRHNKKSYKIYIGKTMSLANRLLNYVSDFQAHSPNDYKLRIFVAYLTELAPDAVLDLHFAATDAADLKDSEKAAVRKYDPLLNGRLRPSVEAKNKLMSAFEFYYRTAFESRLSMSDASSVPKQLNKAMRGV